MRSVTPYEMRELDRRTIDEFGTPGEVLMERAGRGLADSILRRKHWLGGRCRGVIAVAGRGNNGGDAFVASRILTEENVAVRLITACRLEDYKGDAAIHLHRMMEAGVNPSVITEPEGWDSLASDCKDQIVVDGLLGTGTKGAARGAPAAAIKWINRLRQSNTIVAIDIPSGLNGETGLAEGDTVIADCTVTMGFPKTGIIAQPALEYVGNLEVVDIGIPDDYTCKPGPPPEFLSQAETAHLMPSRSATSHKGTHGTALVIAGSGSFPGAAVLCAMGAVRSGAGLVNVVTTENAAASVAAAVPEAIVRAVKPDGTGAMDPTAVKSAVEAAAKYHSVVLGPGMTDADATLQIVKWVLERGDKPVVLDADALNVMARCGPEITCAADAVMTPHPGEAARLLGASTAEVQSDRPGALRRLACKYRAVMVLKGAGTLISSLKDEYINLTGNAGMAKGGSGDVLAGLIGGLLAQGIEAPAAARLGVYVHGRAGDIAACRGSMQGMTASDTASCLPDAFASLA